MIVRISTLMAVIFALFSVSSAQASNPPSTCNSSHKPMVMVHGWNDNTRAFNSMKSYLANNGFSTCKMYTFGYSSTRNSNKTSAYYLRNYMNNVSSQNGGKKVTLITHSNGGLVGRWYRVMLGGTAKNDRFVALGAPHRGTSSAYLCFDPACYEMRPGSSFINALGGRGCQYSIWSNVDAIINPSSSAACGYSYRTPGLIGHGGLLWRVGSLNILKNLIPKY